MDQLKHVRRAIRPERTSCYVCILPDLETSIVLEWKFVSVSVSVLICLQFYMVFEPHWIQEMQTIAIDDTGVCQCVSVTRERCAQQAEKMGVLFWVKTARGTKQLCVRYRSPLPHGYTAGGSMRAAITKLFSPLVIWLSKITSFSFVFSFSFCRPTQCCLLWQLGCLYACLSRWCIVPKRLRRSSCDLYQIVAQPL